MVNNVIIDGQCSQRQLKSAPTPADWSSKPVKVLTGNNFAEVVLNPDKHVFIEICEFTDLDITTIGHATIP